MQQQRFTDTNCSNEINSKRRQLWVFLVLILSMILFIVPRLNRAASAFTAIFPSANSFYVKIGIYSSSAKKLFQEPKIALGKDQVYKELGLYMQIPKIHNFNSFR